LAQQDTGTNSPNSDEPKHRGGLRRAGWKVWATIGVAIVLAGVAGYYLIRQSDLSARLMRVDPDTIADDAELSRFAIASARPAYDRNCAACHGADLRGDHFRGAPNLTDDDWLYGEGRVAQIEHTILYGIRASNGKTLDYADMPGFGRPVPYKRYKIEPLEPGEIRDVIEFLMVKAGKPGDETAAARGAKIFGGDGQCFDCHSGDAKGDTAIGAPNLVDDVWLYGTGTRDDIFDTIAKGASGFCPPWFRQLDAVTIRALAVLINQASHVPPTRAASPSIGRSPGTAG
jgi:cytochrome c oxidase cbb3-type subunit 3